MVINQEALAYYYHKWFKSKPINLGFAVSASLGRLANFDAPQAKVAIEGANQINTANYSNETIARIVPLAIWASKMKNKEDFVKVILTDVELTHSDPCTQQGVYMYCRLIKYLLDNWD